MKVIRLILLSLIILTSFNTFSHNPEDFMIAEIERGQMYFENDEIAAEYGAALKRQRIRRLAAMPFYKKFYIFVKAGFEHIIPQGIDHILFVLGLFFSCITFRSLLWQVTAFTVAHSITLILAAQGFVQLRGDIVEAIIALSIVWVAVENVLFKQIALSQLSRMVEGRTSKRPLLSSHTTRIYTCVLYLPMANPLLCYESRQPQ